ncbi:MAG TPA: UbiX family flavin prenyltransferase [Turneriella sp.]|nr:UbiX family flavin prenyltransferase [Turneriella sp.]
MNPRYIIGITGASGVDYALRFLWRLSFVAGKSDVIVSPNFYQVLSAETNRGQQPRTENVGIQAHDVFKGIKILIEEMYGKMANRHHFQAADYHNIGAEAASGSVRYNAMVVLPCSMKTVASIAHGLSQNLIERAADVSLKERRPLILCPRETPLSPIHLRNMLTLTEAGATVMPLMPGYYHKPSTFTDLYDFMCDRIFQHIGIDERVIQPWLS